MSTEQVLIESKIDALKKARDYIDSMIDTYSRLTSEPELNLDKEVDADMFGGDGIDD